MSETPKGGPTVSVVVPCKNDARFLTASLESILCQDYPHLECIVVDGGSTDATIELLERYGDRIRWVSEPDRGAFDAINRGWKLSTGDILAWLNADDLWLPGAVRAAVTEFERHPDVDVVYGTAGVIDELGRVHGNLVPRTWDLEYALRHCDHIIFQPASFIRRSMLEEVGWLYPAWCHDHDLWLRIARAGGTFTKFSRRLAMDRLRLDNLGRVAETVVPAKIDLTRRFFDAPGLPPHIRTLRRRALSGAYLRALDYLQSDRPRHWVWAVALTLRAFVADPLNVRTIGKRVRRPARAGSLVLLSVGRRFLVAIGRALVRLAAFPVTASRRMMERLVEWVFKTGNRRLAKKLDRLADSLESVRRQHDARLRAVEKKIPQAVQHLAAQIDRIAADFPQLAIGIGAVEQAFPKALESLTPRIDRITEDVPQLAKVLERDRHEIQNSLDRLRRQHEVRLDAVEQAVPNALQPLTARIDALSGALEAARERPSVTLSEALREVYGTLPTLRRIPGWHTACGVDKSEAPLSKSRVDRWSSLNGPVVMRWFADLLVVIWPGNELSRVLFLTGSFEPNELTWITETLTEGKTLIDVGAHMGMYTMIASKLVGESGTVIAMEPSTREFQRLSFHVTLNELTNVRCLQEAASDAAGEATLKIAWEKNSGHNTFGEFFNPSVQRIREERVRTRTVDAIVAAYGLDRVDVIKVDAEGHELKVLAGAAETLVRFRPRVLIEVFETTLRAQGASVDAVLAFLKRHGYALHEFSDTTGELVPLSRSVGNGSQNLVAVPQ